MNEIRAEDIPSAKAATSELTLFVEPAEWHRVSELLTRLGWKWADGAAPSGYAPEHIVDGRSIGVALCVGGYLTWMSGDRAIGGGAYRVAFGRAARPGSGVYCGDGSHPRKVVPLGIGPAAPTIVVCELCKVEAI